VTAAAAATPGCLDDAARARLSAFIAGVERAAPGRLEGLYLYGSAALCDYRPGQSDLDFAAVSTAAWPPESLSRLGRLHARLARAPGQPAVDGLYLTWAELGGDPTRAVAPGALGGAVQRRGAFDANWAVWETLHRYPLALRGPTQPAVRTDAGGLKAFCLGNLASYWQPLAQRVAAEGALDPDRAAAALLWCVPGVLRLAYTVATGDVTSKSGAVRWALARTQTRWAPILRRALALRQGRADPDPNGACDTGPERVAAYMIEVIEGARGGADVVARA